MKSLFLYRYFYNLKDKVSSELQALFNRGINVGLLARKLFPGGIDASPGSVSKYGESVVKTKELIDAGASVIYEAAFQHEQVLCAVDILVREGSRWKVFEVKSSSKISQVYLMDASLQYQVIKNSGIDILDFSIIYINNQYVLGDSLDLGGLFVISSVMEEVKKNQDQIKRKIEEAKAVLAGRIMPEIAIGRHCFVPYPCDFMGHCWKDVPANSVLEVPGVSKAELFSLYESGIKTIGELPAGYNPGKSARIHLESEGGKEIYIDKVGLKKFMDELKYPLLFIDFESFMPAVPLFKGTRPYQHIPFQYSIHKKTSRDSKVEHLEFLSETGLDPRKLFLERFMKDTAVDGTILVYDTTFEKGILNALKITFPHFSKGIEERIGRMKDLMKPIADKLIYHSAMKGSSSIKSVLPALVPDLNYEGLKISSGVMAMVSFERLQTESDIFKIAETRDALLEYCSLDTLAMVRILEVIEKAIENPDFS